MTNAYLSESTLNGKTIEIIDFNTQKPQSVTLTYNTAADKNGADNSATKDSLVGEPGILRADLIGTNRQTFDAKNVETDAAAKAKTFSSYYYSHTANVGNIHNVLVVSETTGKVYWCPRYTVRNAAGELIQNQQVATISPAHAFLPRQHKNLITNALKNFDKQQEVDDTEQTTSITPTSDDTSKTQKQPRGRKPGYTVPKKQPSEHQLAVLTTARQPISEQSLRQIQDKLDKLTKSKWTMKPKLCDPSITHTQLKSFIIALASKINELYSEQDWATLREESDIFAHLPSISGIPVGIQIQLMNKAGKPTTQSNFTGIRLSLAGELAFLTKGARAILAFEGAL